MHAIRISPHAHARNPTTGQTCSAYGAIPEGYEVEQTGEWAVWMNDNTIRHVEPDQHAAIIRANAINTVRISELADHAELYPETRERCGVLQAQIPHFTPEGEPVTN